MKIQKVAYYKSFTRVEDLPPSPYAEIAFIGRSNVGKSSLLNHLCNQRIAMTSSTPGKTRMLNYFLVNNSFYFVDLPGYGYAKVPGQLKKAWSQEVETYLQSREQLKVLLLLLDIRRKPNAQDHLINDWFKNLKDVRTIYVLTKADKFSRSKAMSQKVMIAKELFVDQKDFILYSSTKNQGKKELLTQLQASL